MRAKPPVGHLPSRGIDNWGSGAFGASRGPEHTHEGEDFACYPGTGVFPVRPGRVVRLGYPYGDDLSYRLVEIIDSRGFKVAYMYVEPCVVPGQEVGIYDFIGIVQDISKRYPNITHHFHMEVRDPQGKLMDPKEYINA